MWEGAAIALMAAAVFLWLDSLRARERAVKAGRAACERYALQFLDETVSFTRMRLRRDAEGQLRIARTYTLSFRTPGITAPRRHRDAGGELHLPDGALPCSMSKWLEGR